MAMIGYELLEFGLEMDRVRLRDVTSVLYYTWQIVACYTFDPGSCANAHLLYLIPQRYLLKTRWIRVVWYFHLSQP